MPTLYILRGVSGAGKSTLKNSLVSNFMETPDVWEADWYWIKQNIDFDPKLLDEAHKWCYDSTVNSMLLQTENIIVSNTFTTENELQQYLDLAEKFNYKVFSLIVENRKNTTNIHSVPEKTLERQERRLRNSIKLR